MEYMLKICIFQLDLPVTLTFSPSLCLQAVHCSFSVKRQMCH